jgi:hypothetical protein
MPEMGTISWGSRIIHPSLDKLGWQMVPFNSAGMTETAKVQNIRNEEYYRLVKEKSVLLEADLARLKAGGLGHAHPGRRMIEAQINALAKLMKNGQGKLAVPRMVPEKDYFLVVLGIPTTEHRKWKNEYAITEEGDIHLPLLGKVRIGGMTIPKAERTIESHLKKSSIFTAPRVLLKPTETAQTKGVGADAENAP